MGDWDAGLYDKKHDFVSEYGKGLLEFVPMNKNQNILDLGFGLWDRNAYGAIVRLCRYNCWC